MSCYYFLYIYHLAFIGGMNNPVYLYSLIIRPHFISDHCFWVAAVLCSWSRLDYAGQKLNELYLSFQDSHFLRLISCWKIYPFITNLMLVRKPLPSHCWPLLILRLFLWRLLQWDKWGKDSCTTRVCCSAYPRARAPWATARGLSKGCICNTTWGPEAKRS